MTIDKSVLKALAENTKGWDKLTECWPSGESEPDWEVGAVSEDGDRYPVLTVNTDQYDAEHDAVKLAQYYAAANPAAILALLAENERLEREAKNDLIAYKAAIERQKEIRADANYDKGKFEEWQASHHANYCKVADERDQLKAESDALRLRCERLEADKQAMAETHVLYTWLRKKCDQPSSDVVAVHMNIGHDWVTVRDLDKDLRSMIDAEEP